MAHRQPVGVMQDSIRFFFGSSKNSYGLADLLPQRFGPADLLTDPHAPLLLQPQHNPIELTPGNESKNVFKNSSDNNNCEGTGEVTLNVTAVVVGNNQQTTNKDAYLLMLSRACH